MQRPIADSQPTGGGYRCSETQGSFGPMASGDTVMMSSETRDRIGLQTGALGIEMEGAGVWGTFPCTLLIKGICDYSDSHKTKAFQHYAAATAAACAKVILEEWPLEPGYAFFLFPFPFSFLPGSQGELLSSSVSAARQVRTDLVSSATMPRQPSIPTTPAPSSPRVHKAKRGAPHSISWPSWSWSWPCLPASPWCCTVVNSASYVSTSFLPYIESL